MKFKPDGIPKITLLPVLVLKKPSLGSRLILITISDNNKNNNNCNQPANFSAFSRHLLRLSLIIIKRNVSNSSAV